MKQYFKHYSSLDMATMLILIAGIFAIDFEKSVLWGKSQASFYTWL